MRAFARPDNILVARVVEPTRSNAPKNTIFAE
jgi:hypothetical protein